MKTVWLDVETTGLDPKDSEITEIAMIFEDSETKETDTLHRYIKYTKYPDNYDSVIAPITGLTREKLDEFGFASEEAWDDVLDFLNKHMDKYKPQDKAVMCAYASGFDEGFMRAFLEKFNRTKYRIYGSYFYTASIDVKSIVMLMVKNGILPVLKNFKLVTVCEHYNIKFEAHSAKEDIGATKSLLDMLMADYQSKFLEAVKLMKTEVIQK